MTSEDMKDWDIRAQKALERMESGEFCELKAVSLPDTLNEINEEYLEYRLNLKPGIEAIKFVDYCKMRGIV